MKEFTTKIELWNNELGTIVVSVTIYAKKAYDKDLSRSCWIPNDYRLGRYYCMYGESEGIERIVCRSFRKFWDEHKYTTLLATVNGWRAELVD